MSKTSDVIKELATGLRKYGFFENIPSDGTPQLCKQRTAVIVGIVATLVILGFAAFVVVYFVAAIITSLIFFLGGLYGLMVVLAYWASSARGTSFKKCLFSLLAPIVVIFAAIFGSSTIREQITTVRSSDNGTKLSSRSVAIILGVLLTLIDLAAIAFGIYTAYRALLNVGLILVVFYLIGVLSQFWGSRAYEAGITLLEAVKALLSFFGAVALFRTSASPVTQPAPGGTASSATTNPATS